MNASACGLRIKRSFSDVVGALCHAFTVTQHPLPIGGEKRPPQKGRWRPVAPTIARRSSTSSQFAWPARHPAEMGLLLQPVRAHCQQPLHRDGRR